jgi:hypothetical protein
MIGTIALTEFLLFSKWNKLPCLVFSLLFVCMSLFVSLFVVFTLYLSFGPLSKHVNK